MSEIEFGREEIDKWKGGASNIPTLRQALEAVSEFFETSVKFC